MKRIISIIAAAALLGGCGAEWFPEEKMDGSVTTQPAITSTSAGTLVASIKKGPQDYTITTTRGVFTTYTSLAVPFETPVYLEQYTDPVTKLQIGKVLRAMKQTVLIREILALVK